MLVATAAEPRTTDTGAAPAIALRGIRKVFGSGSGAVTAVHDLDLDISDGEFVTLLGPSGSGKTTVLRIVAGFEQPTAGRVLLRGRDVTGVAPFDRDVHTVFQDYALFPHMSVRRNVEYPLRIAKVGRTERRDRAMEALETVRLGPMADRAPTELSGGQRQRVALARALVDRPSVLLLDEPLGALDLKLREQMQLELKDIQRKSGITFVLVTHDQDEALTLADRIVVFNDGRVEQAGAAHEVYEHPASPFVAGFVGTSNLVGPEVAPAVLGREGSWSVRPEKIAISEPDADVPAGHVGADGTVSELVYTGPTTRCVVALDAGASLSVLLLNGGQRDTAPERGARVRLSWHPDHQIPLG
ncbi:ABC transporter ATP-binding protein [Pseudonocardia kujensis]|uniref:ABC transporter ATP-binding protein n=1 Tax=Pseudonocardia kujensis TaxID=1128675 RepID=UPI001E2D48A1|nr:ABC transporter ATP-binding protein [Pseudonocardia kujensis]MCE0761616.1 ABC transporter ATP-binding protein [Pseudonocardia kujensis]